MTHCTLFFVNVLNDLKYSTFRPN